MEGADPRDVGFAKWLVDVDKVVLSSTLDEAPWERTTMVDRPTAEVVAELKETDGGDILVPSSPSVIKALLAADLVDRLAMTVFPVFLGGGPRLFDDGLPAGQWTLAGQTAGELARWCSSTTGCAERRSTAPAHRHDLSGPGERHGHRDGRVALRPGTARVDGPVG